MEMDHSGGSGRGERNKKWREQKVEASREALINLSARDGRGGQAGRVTKTQQRISETFQSIWMKQQIRQFAMNQKIRKIGT